MNKTHMDLYTVLEFTRHYNIEDSFPSILYVEALLLSETSSNHYRDRIIGVLEDVHQHQVFNFVQVCAHSLIELRNCTSS